jgi:membrane-bound serine protease (ClpP class)
MFRYGVADEKVRSDEELRAFFGAKHLMRLDQSWSEGLVAFLTLLPVRGLLLVIFLIGLFIEMTHPGAFMPGAIAVVALVGLVAPPLLIDLANWWQGAAILVGIVLIALEIFVFPGFGVPGVLGLLLVLGGLVGVFVPQGVTFPGTPLQERGLAAGAVTVLLSMMTAGVGMYFIARHFGSIPILGRLVLKDGPAEESSSDEMLLAMAETQGDVKVGTVGVAITPLRPAGRVDLDGRVVDVVAGIGFIPSGARVCVTGVSEFRITVEPYGA